MESIVFWTVIVLGIIGVRKFCEMRKKRLWKVRLICTALLWGMFWCPTTLAWAYTHPLASSGYAMAIATTGYKTHSHVKKTIKKSLGWVNLSLGRVTPEKGTRLVSKAHNVIRPAANLTQEIAHDIGLQPVSQSYLYANGYGEGLGALQVQSLKTQ